MIQSLFVTSTRANSRANRKQNWEGYFVQLTLTLKASRQPRTVSVINIPLCAVRFSTKKQAQFFPSLSEPRCFFILGLLTFNFSCSMVVSNHFSGRLFCLRMHLPIVLVLNNFCSFHVLAQNALTNRFSGLGLSQGRRDLLRLVV